MGNTCYANAVIQCFRHCPRVTWLLSEGRYNTLFKKDAEESSKRAKQQTLTTSFASVVQLLQKCSKGQSVRPADFWGRVGPVVEDTLYEHLAYRHQHDSHEFYMFLLETLHEATALNVEMRITRPPPTTPEEHLIHGALTSWSKEFSKEYSPFVDLFYGLNHWRTTCQGCGNVSHRWESFNSLKGVVPPRGMGDTGEPPTLLSMLEGEMEPETVDGYHCDKCPQRTTARRVSRLWRLPQNLVIVLKRFTPDGRKIHTRMAPLDGGRHPILNLHSHFSLESPERKGVTTYELRGIVDHHGIANGGHYTAQACHPSTQAWHLYDDESIHDLPNGPMTGESTYVLFWTRTSTPAVAPEA